MTDDDTERLSGDDTVTVVYGFDEIEHTPEGIAVPCRNCGTLVFIHHVASMGCHICDVEPRNVAIEAEEKG